MTSFEKPRTPPTLIAIATTAAGVSVYPRKCYVHGFALRETTGAAVADCDLVDGASGAGDAAIPITLTAGQSTREPLAAGGVFFESGVFLAVNAGTVRGAIWVEPA